MMAGGDLWAKSDRMLSVIKTGLIIISIIGVGYVQNAVFRNHVQEQEKQQREKNKRFEKQIDELKKASIKTEKKVVEMNVNIKHMSTTIEKIYNKIMSIIKNKASYE